MRRSLPADRFLGRADYLICGKDVAICTQKLNAFWAQVAPRYKTCRPS